MSQESERERGEGKEQARLLHVRARSGPTFNYQQNVFSRARLYSHPEGLIIPLITSTSRRRRRRRGSYVDG